MRRVVGGLVSPERAARCNRTSPMVERTVDGRIGTHGNQPADSTYLLLAAPISVLTTYYLLYYILIYKQ